MLLPGGAYAEDAAVSAHTTFIIPESVSFEEASTIPLTILPAALPLFRRQNLPSPWARRSDYAEPLPLIIYGDSSALGTFAAKIAALSSIHPIIAISGSTTTHLSSVLDTSKGDRIVDYHQGPQAMKISVKEALGGLKAYHALDAISENSSWIPITEMLSPSGYLSVVQGGLPDTYKDPRIPSDITVGYTYVGSAHYGFFQPNMPNQPEDKDSVTADIEFAYVFLRFIARVLAKGTISGHPWEVILGGLGGVEKRLQKLQRGEARGVKYVYRISETEGVQE